MSVSSLGKLHISLDSRHLEDAVVSKFALMFSEVIVTFILVFAVCIF